MLLFRFILRWAGKLRYSRRNVVLVLLASLVSGASNTALLVLINYALKSDGAPPPGVVRNFAALCLILPVAGFASAYLSNHLAAGVSLDLRLQFSRRILATPLRPLEEIGSHGITATLGQDIPAITEAISVVPFLGMNAVIVAGCIAYMAWLSTTPLVWGVGLLVAGIVIYYLLTKRAFVHFDQARREWDRLYAHFNAVARGTKELKLSGARQEAFLDEELQPTGERLRRSELRGVAFSAVAASWGATLAFVAIGLILFVMPRSTATQNHVLTGYALTILYMLGPLGSILNLLPLLGRANAAVRTIENLGVSLDRHRPEGAGAGLTASTCASLRLVNVTHAYRQEEGREFILGPLSLDFRPGELIFIIGGNGSGKTTLAKILAGLYLPDDGEVLLDGRPVTHENRDFYRHHFSVVFSDFYVFDKLLGLKSPRLDERAAEYLKRLQIDHRVSVKDGAFSTVELSHGQSKRLALLTAYLENRPVYIFDELAAGQDPDFTAYFYLRLLPELKAEGKMVFVISHDDRYYHVADRLIKLEYGQLVSDERAARAGAAPAFEGGGTARG